MIRLNQKEHLFRLGYTIAVVHFKALLTLLTSIGVICITPTDCPLTAFGFPSLSTWMIASMIGFQLKASAFLLFVAFPPAKAVVQHMARVITTKLAFLTI